MEEDVQAFNWLAARHKKLRFAKSSIHNIGLFAMERIGMGVGVDAGVTACLEHGCQVIAIRSGFGKVEDASIYALPVSL